MLSLIASRVQQKTRVISLRRRHRVEFARDIAKRGLLGLEILHLAPTGIGNDRLHETVGDRSKLRRRTSPVVLAAPAWAARGVLLEKLPDAILADFRGRPDGETVGGHDHGTCGPRCAARNQGDYTRSQPPRTRRQRPHAAPPRRFDYAPTPPRDTMCATYQALASARRVRSTHPPRCEGFSTYLPAAIDGGFRRSYHLLRAWGIGVGRFFVCGRVCSNRRCSECPSLPATLVAARQSLPARQS